MERERQLYKFDAEDREKITAQMCADLSEQPEILFAYLYGSFAESEGFHDIDVGVYLRTSEEAEATKVASRLACRLNSRLKLPVDVRVVNFAPVPFLYHVLRGRLVISRDEEFRSSVVEDTVRRYLDIAPLLRSSTKEAFAG